MGEQGWRSGQSASLPPRMCPAVCHTWAEFHVVDSRLAPTVFLRADSPVFTNNSKFQFDHDKGHAQENQQRGDVVSSLNIITYL